MNTENIIYAKLTYKCQPEDAYTGASKGSGIIIIDKYTKQVAWTKVRGCNPYWWQVSDAIMKIVPPEWYIRSERVHPFNVRIREGYTGHEYIHLNLFRRLTTGKYVNIKCSAKMEISSTNKIEDFEIYYGDLVEIAGALYEKRGWEFSRNPRSFKPYKWSIAKIEPYEIVNANEVYDPQIVKEKYDYYKDTKRRGNPRNKKYYNTYSREE
jgi:hypothetical protein